MNKKFMKYVLSALLFAVVLTGCSAKNDAEKPLVLQFVPTNNDGSMQAKAKPFAEYLSEKLGREVQVTLATDYSTIVEAMASGKVDIGIMPPAAYLQAREKGAATAILTSQLGAFNPETGLPEADKLTGTFKAEILVRKDSGLNTLQDLVGKKIVTLQPNSASGYIYPVAEMRMAGIDPVTETTLTIVNDIPSEITAVLNGQQDAAFVFQGARVVFGGKFEGHNLMDELKVLHLSDGDIPNDAIAVKPGTDEALIKQIKEVFLNMSKDEAGLEAMSMWSHKGYVEADEKNYDTIDTYAKKAAE
ncbi:phosphate/phosphite/phosphonate ABC transporter substrate-binding protein [Erysipelothrix sp. HDW6C]|uniref:phosphate/phosphite/phosphonate ABC transporter substrate-binding protein n=1 Tax=Erysipelothrix sp. HDW6C TaxID=2714930 RepID=UPI00140A5AB1|nr:phosphate/phosphite/phosphonate ABC transporter substrate-binding protein [Erysipelothrix sp. HDW6C]QIK70628.1 phosphate/phosphite/phosphonate ABC transporter substrate-binding protein [Erysipelothrix sp. HDW6C]